MIHRVRHSRTAVTWTAACLLLLAVAAAVGVWGAVSSADARVRAWTAATATTEGTYGSGFGDVVEVAWSDAAGDEYRVSVPTAVLPDGEVGSTVVRYDPQNPLGPVFVGTEAAAPPAPAGAQVALVLGVLSVPLVAWAVRWGRLLVLRRTPEAEVHVQALLTCEDPTDPAVVRRLRRLRPQVWLRIGTPPGADDVAAVRYQRVLWDPALAGLAHGGVVTARLPPAGSRRGAATVLPGGVAVLPVGPLSDRAPRSPLAPAVTRPWTWRTTGLRLTPAPLIFAVLTVRGVLNVLTTEGIPSGAGAPAAVVLAALAAVAWLWSGPVPQRAPAPAAAVTG